MIQNKCGVFRQCLMRLMLVLLLCGIGSFWMTGSRAEAAGQKQQAQTTAAAKTKLNKSKVTMLMGTTQQLKLMHVPSGKVTWSSSAPSVATISSGGKLRAKSNGRCVITAKYKNMVYRCAVTVYSSHKAQKTAELQQKYNKSENQGKIVLAGSSMLEFWKGASAAFAPYEVVNVGIGGTTVDDWLQLYPRLIVKYKPKAVVLYVGGNNIRSDAANTGKTTSAKLQKLLKKLREALPGVPIYYVSIHPNYARLSSWKQTQICNKLTKQFCAKQKKTYFIDITPYCLTKKGLPDKSLLRNDLLHFNSKGYAKIWKNIIAARVKKDLSAGKK